jgi:F-type H+-transporting ATPase subunit b
MIPTMLAAATEVVPGAEETVLQRFGVEPTFLLMQVISFSILAYVLYRFMIKPVVATVDERNQKIADGLKYTDEMKAKLEALEQESAASAKRAQAEATRIIDEARKSAKEFLDKQTQESAAKASEILVKAQQVIELEKKKMLAEARTEIARLVVSITERVLSKELSDAERSRYNESATSELTKV